MTAGTSTEGSAEAKTVMPPAGSYAPSAELSFRSLVKGLLNFRDIIKDLKKNESSATLNRLFDSQHVLDLKLILSISLLSSLSAVALILIIVTFDHFGSIFTSGGSINFQSILMRFGDTVSTSLQLIGPIAAVFGVIAAWAYRSASTRLGIVDLFASEIRSSCRVGTVFDIASRLATAYHSNGHSEQNVMLHDRKQPSVDLSHFDSKEDYFQVFGSNTRDLQLLEERVVVTITGFYTYMKAMRDSLRRLENLPQGSKQWRYTLCNVIYMVFLAYEQAREAIELLVEFQPDRAESKVTILITEIEAFGFLRDYFDVNTDFRGQRLQLRVDGYKALVPDLAKKISGCLAKEICASKDDRKNSPHKKEAWQKAHTTMAELADRYRRIFRDDEVGDAAISQAGYPRRIG